MPAAQIMVTNGGPHPPESWAEVTSNWIVQDLIPVDPAHPDAAKWRLARDELEMKLRKALVSHHANTQDYARRKLKQVGHDRLSHEPDAGPHVDDAMAAIVEAAKGTPFEAHFTTDKVAEYCRKTLGQHFRTVDHIERSWHADRNPEIEQAKAFRAAKNTGPHPSIASSAPEAPAIA